MQKMLTKNIGSIGYDILDNVVAVECGVSGIVADLYLATVEDYAENAEQVERVYKKICIRYGLPVEFWEYYEFMPIALIALYIMENTNFLETHPQV